MDNTRIKVRQLQEAIEGDNITLELREYICRLQDKLTKLRSLGGAYSNVDFSPYLKELQGVGQVQPVAAIENKRRSKSGKAAHTI